MYTRFHHATNPPRRDRQGGWCLTWHLAAVLALGLVLATPPRAHATTFRCDAEDVQCLIDAINEANANGEENTIHLAAGTYTLTTINNVTDFDPNGLPVITSLLTIRGAGAATTIIEQGGTSGFRLLRVAETGNLMLNGLTLRGGFLFGNGSGAGLYNSGTAMLANCTLVDNQAIVFATGGGGIYNDGIMTLTNCTLAHNRVTDSSGGGILNAGTMTLTNCTLVDNTSLVGGGGGGIFNASTGTMALANCTLARNTASSAPNNGGGGGIANNGIMALTNCTLVDNMGNGGGIFNAGTLMLTNATVARNASTGSGAGGLRNSINGSATLQNTILALNTVLFPPPPGDDCDGVVTSLGNNLIGDPPGCSLTLLPSDLTGDPALGDFTDNGRPGNGHVPLLPDSPAIDTGNDAGCPRWDQLGQRRVNIPRVGTSRCDMGAIEFQHRDKHHDDKEHDAPHTAPAPVTQVTP